MNGSWTCDSESEAMGNAQQINEATPAMAWKSKTPSESWYALQTRPRHEKRAAIQLQTKGITTFLPLVSQVHRWSDRSKVVEVPLFPGYAFVRMIATADNYLRTLRTVGVVSFVGVRGEGLPIPDKQIQDIQTLLAQQSPGKPHPFLRVGQRVRIRGGCLDGIEGILVTLDSSRSLVVSIDVLRRSLAVRIEGYDLEILSSPAPAVQAEGNTSRPS
jgi:transcription antitermination factor NusG